MSGKKFIDARKLIDFKQMYEVKEGFSLIKQVSTAKFDETVEVAITLRIDPKCADQQIRGTLVLPYGTGKSKRVLVFAKGEKLKDAEAAGADFVGSEELVTKIQKGWLDFDVVISTPEMMPALGNLGKILGPRGLMPNPKLGTVTTDVIRAINEIKAGKIEYRADKGGNVHAPIGKISFDTQKLIDNFYSLINILLKEKPVSSKGQYIKGIVLTATMEPGIKLNHQNLIK